MTDDAAALRAQVESLEQRCRELETVRDGVVEHATWIENEILAQNARVEEHLRRLARYLSPQLYQIVTGRDAGAAPSHRRRRLTLFSSSLVGFDAVTESVEPETLAEALNRYLDAMAQIAIEHGGTIDRFAGDAISIFFGDPIATDDHAHALRAARMAIAMRDAMPEIHRAWRRAGVSSPLLFRAGIHTGYCTVGDFGSGERMTYTAVGAQADVAARLARLAVPGTVVVSEATRALVEAEIDAAYLGAASLRGSRRPMKTYELRGVRDAERADPYLAIHAGEVSLTNIAFSTASTDDATRRAMSAALRTALRLLEDGAARAEEP